MRKEFWAIFGTALVLADKDLDYFLKKAKWRDVIELVEYYENYMNIDYFGKKEVEGFTFKSLDGEYQELDEALVIYAKRQPKIFAPSYNDRKELVDEFRSVVGDLYETDEEYAAHIGSFSCTLEARRDDGYPKPPKAVLKNE